VTEKRVSVAGVRRDQLREGRKLQESILKKAQANIGDVKGLSAVTADSFVNFAQLMGIGAENPLGSASYGFNPVTRIGRSWSGATVARGSAESPSTWSPTT
jgi:hypothetical protein